MISLPASYTDVPTVYATVPAVQSATTITSAQILLEVGKAQAYIDSKLSTRYSVPFTSAPPLVVHICTDMSLYYLLSKRVFASDRLYDEKMLSGLKMSFDVLDALSEGKMTLTNSDGTAVTQGGTYEEAWSDNQNYIETMHEGDVDLQVRDDDKLEDIYDDRNL